MNPTRLPHLINGTLALFLLGGSVLVYPSLPEQIPQHAGVLGGPVSYWETTFFRWLLGVGPVLVVTGILYGIALMAPPRTILDAFGPSAVDTYEELSARHKETVDDLLRRVTYWTAAPLLTTFTAMQVGQYVVATTSATRVPPIAVMTMWGAVGVLVVGHLAARWWIPKRIGRIAETE